MNTEYTICETNFSIVEPIWRDQLWPGRKSAIEPISWIDESGKINLSLEIAEPFFLKMENSLGETVGVISGHGTSRDNFRSRGLWVDLKHRHLGLGTQLMNRLFKESRKKSYKKIWTMPRFTNWNFYEKLEFKKILITYDYEFGPHYIADLDLTSLDSEELTRDT